MGPLDAVLLVGILFLIPSFFFLLEVFFGIKKTKPVVREHSNKTSVIMIPAHDEEEVIASTIKGVKHELGPDDRILVIADNCSDETADIARKLGCEVIERNDAKRRGKGYALAFGVSYLRQNAPDIAIIVDADCEVAPGAISSLKQACSELKKPVQAYYLLYAPKDGQPEQRVSEFAIYLKNHIRLRGLARLGGSIPITGSGFAVPFSLLQSMDLATGEIVEDMKLGIELALSGESICYVSDAQITSPLPSIGGIADLQRQRWEHGHVGMIRAFLPKLIKGAWSKRSWPLLMLSLDMSVLPLTLLLACNTLLWLVSLAIALLSGDPRLFLLTNTVMILIVVALICVSVTSGKSYIRWSDPLQFLKLTFKKAAIYRALITGETSEWLKTKRDK